MKRIILLLAIISVVSCEYIGTKDYSKELEEIDKAKSDAIQAIKDQAAGAQKTISLSISKAMEGANNDLSLSINSAKEDIKYSVQESVKTAMDGKLANLSSEISETKHISRIALWLVLSALLLVIGAIFYIILLSKEMKRIQSGNHIRDGVVEIVTESDRIKKYFSCLIQPYFNKQISKSEIESIVLKILEQKQNLGGSSQKPHDVVIPKKDISNIPEVGQTVKPSIEQPKASQEAEPVNTKIELYARDSNSSELLSSVHSTFQQGKSIYKLILSGKDECYADLTLCLDQDVQRRILKSGDAFLVPVCRIERKSSEPEVVAVSSIGKAEKVSADTWKVVTPISVILS